MMFPGADAAGGAAAGRRNVVAISAAAAGWPTARITQPVAVIPPNGTAIVGEQGPELIQAAPTPMKVLNMDHTEGLGRYTWQPPGLYPSTDSATSVTALPKSTPCVLSRGYSCGQGCSKRLSKVAHAG